MTLKETTYTKAPDREVRLSPAAHNDREVRLSPAAHNDREVRLSSAAHNDREVRLSSAAHNDREVRLSSAAHRSSRRGVEDNSPSRSSIHSPSGSTALRIAHCALSIIICALCLAMASCAVDKDFDRTDPGTSSTDTPATISLRISTPEANSTRSDRDAHFYEVRSEDPDTELQSGLSNELINFWWIAFVDKNTKKVKAIVQDRGNLNQNEGGVPTDEDSLEEIEMPEGTYNIYAFANITPEELQKHTGLKFSDRKDDTGKYVPSDEVLPDADLSKVIFEKIAHYYDSDSKIANGEIELYTSGDPTNPDPKENSYVVKDFLTLSDPSGRELIPMSGYLMNQQVTNDKKFSIEVTRMLSKLQLNIKNTSKLPINVKNIIIGRFTLGDMYLFDQPHPEDETAKDNAFLPKLTDNFIKKTGEQLYMPFKSAWIECGDGLMFDTPYKTGEDGKSYYDSDVKGSERRYLFYLHESIADPAYLEDTETFFIEIKMTRVTEVDTEAETGTRTSTKCAPGSTRADDFDDPGIKPNVEQKIVVVPSNSKGFFSSIRRNDYVVFPIEITDVVVDFIPSYYPPIGGYPQVNIKETEDYTEFIFDADGEGFFSITPMVFADIKKTEPLSVEVELPLYVYDKDKIFKDGQKPTCTDKTDITGTLSGVSGTSEINVRLRVVLPNGTVQTYVRRIKITVEKHQQSASAERN